jgi:hypothetical protein
MTARQAEGASNESIQRQVSHLKNCLGHRAPQTRRWLRWYLGRYLNYYVPRCGCVPDTAARWIICGMHTVPTAAGSIGASEIPGRSGIVSYGPIGAGARRSWRQRPRCWKGCSSPTAGR